MLIQLRPYLRHQAQPLLSQATNFLDLAWVPIRNALEQIKLIVHEAHISNWQHATVHHRHVFMQGLAAKDNALIGFFGGHGVSVADWRAGW